MDYNYHTHTFRCSHATGTPEEYILRAIEGGIRSMGFSDHVPLRFPDGFESSYRVPVDQAETYVREIRELGEKYREQIELFVGFEMEYYPTMFEEMLLFCKNCGAQYLILGEHFNIPEHPAAPHNTIDHADEESLVLYVDTVIEGVQTQVFSYVAHPDLFRFSGDEAVYDRQMKRLCCAARDCDVPLEINFLGIRDGRRYPNPAFWKIAARENAPVTFGFDAHDAAAAWDAASEQVAQEMVKELGLHYIGRPTLRLLK